MKKEENVLPINKNLLVEGFNPDDYKQYYSDGTPYLPFKIQLAWFRMVYPTGKTPVFRPEWDPERNANTYVCTARVYASNEDAIDNYLSEASAKRGPATMAIDEKEVTIDSYQDVQRAALSTALRFAGFWCSITKDDLTKIKDEKVEEAPVETKEASTKTENATGEEAQVETEEAPVETEEAPVETEEAPVETEEASEETEEAPVETEEASEKTEEASEETEEAPVETEETPAETETTEETEETPEETETTEETEETPAETALTEDEEKEIDKLRALPYSNAYYEGSLGDLETKRVEGNENGINLFQWLMTSNIAKRKHADLQVAANRIAELVHKDWIEE